jgi:hypothetical protein
MEQQRGDAQSLKNHNVVKTFQENVSLVGGLTEDQRITPGNVVGYG